MTQITVQDGKVVMRDGKVGTEQACCDGECVEECPCNDFACYENLNISLNGEAASCNAGYYGGFAECGDGGAGSFSFSMYCDETGWFVGASVSCFLNEGICFATYEAKLPCEEDGLPPAGPVDLIETGLFDGGGCPPLPPDVTITK